MRRPDLGSGSAAWRWCRRARRTTRARVKQLAIALVCALGCTLVACGDDGGGSGDGATGSGGSGATTDAVSSAASTSTSTSTSTAATTAASTGTATTTATTSATTGSGGAGGDAADGGGGSGGRAGGGGGGPGSGGADAADGYGAIAGACGQIDLRDIESTSPSYDENSIDFTGERPITTDDTSALTPGGQEMVADGNLGGSSLWSEVFAFEVLARCEGAELVKSEAEIVYDDVGGKKTDILVRIDGVKVGVSVVRAVGFPPEDPYTVDEALPVLEGKLDDILLSSENVSDGDQWEKQILSVLAYSEEHAASMVEAYALLDDATRADTVVLVTVTDGDDDFIYFAE